MFLRAAVFSVCMLSVSEAWLMNTNPHAHHYKRTSSARHFGASGAQEDRYSDLSPEILGSPQWLENLTKTHRTGYYPASWSSTNKPEPSSSLSRKYSTNQYYNEPGSMLSRKSALSSPSPGRPSWSSPSTNLSPEAALSSYSSPELTSNSNLMHPDVSTKIRIQYCPTSAGEAVPPCTPPPEAVAPSLKSQRQPTTVSSTTDTRTDDMPALEPDLERETVSSTPLPYPEHQMMSFLDGGQHILHGNIAEFAEVKSQKNLQVVQAKKQLFQQDNIFVNNEVDESVTNPDFNTEENRTDEIATENDVVEIENRESPSLGDAKTDLRDDTMESEPLSEREEFIAGELARWEEAARRDALRRAKKNDTFVHRADDEGIDLNGLEWTDETPPDTENLD